ncbi:hypothetical protein LINGRAHAP2_LOCUS16136 [Linum grandiflorum]
MRKYYDQGRSDRTFPAGTWVYVRLQVYRQTTVRHQQYHKLAPRYYGPYLVVDRIGDVAYRLALPPSSRIHPVFHVSMLKEAKGNVAGRVQTSLPETTASIPTPQAILERRVRRGRDEVLVHWTDMSPSEATWEDLERLAIQYPDLIDP